MYLKKISLLSCCSWEVRHFKLERSFKNYLLMSCNLEIVFTSPVRIKSFFTLKDKLPEMLHSGLIYKYKCGSYNATYYGKTKRLFKVQIYENLDISHLTGKKNTSYMATTIHPLEAFLF